MLAACAAIPHAIRRALLPSRTAPLAKVATSIPSFSLHGKQFRVGRHTGFEPVLS